ncbi:hypothetical protein DF044_01680 [Burkholderia contaminans]|uniref:ATP-dependent DNA ligase n=1 Tax=Burkholderia contaminans TaxID=488447 RepID=UPI000F5B3D5B|nr:hypothetical protein [Burkholderia contaminans]RQT19398.1 hypothetical protein DF044_01680 [Burkholderia contaminans]
MYRFNRLMAECRGTSSRIEKTEALTKLGAHDDEFAKKMLVAALSPFVTYGVKNFDMPTGFSVENADAGVMFLQLLDDLATRNYTGKAAQSAIANVLSHYTPETAENMACVLRKELRIGIGATEINKVFPDLIPVFDVMLAEKWEPGVIDITYPAQAEFKMDGQRDTVFVIPGQPCEHYSREGLRQPWIEGLFDDEMQAIRQRLCGDEAMVLDGEAMVHVVDPTKKHPSWTATMNCKKEGADRSKLRYYAYDWLPMSEWVKRQCSRNQELRSSMLDAAIADLELTKILPSYKEVVRDRAEVNAMFDKALALSYEGLMIKDPTAMYEWDRSTFWLKAKPLHTATLKIVGIYAGKKKSRNEHRLGGFELEGTIENGTEIKTNCGGGFTDDQRELFFEHPEMVVGRMAEVEYTEVTKKNALRNPVFLRFPDGN